MPSPSTPRCLGSPTPPLPFSWPASATATETSPMALSPARSAWGNSAIATATRCPLSANLKRLDCGKQTGKQTALDGGSMITKTTSQVGLKCSQSASTRRSFGLWLDGKAASILGLAAEANAKQTRSKKEAPYPYPYPYLYKR